MIHWKEWHSGRVGLCTRLWNYVRIHIAGLLSHFKRKLLSGDVHENLSHVSQGHCINNTLGARQHGRHFPDDTFKWIFLNENVWSSIKISLKFVPQGQINNIPALVQIMAWRRPGDKPLSEPMMVSLLTHICVTRPQWVNAGATLNTCNVEYVCVCQ